MGKYSFDFKRNDYMSPPELVELALTKLNIPVFDLDTCCTQENIPALHYYKDGEKDGLRDYWHLHNWCNPPYNECEKWVKRAYEEQQKGKTTVLLIPVRTETRYWHKYILFNPNVEIEWLLKGYKFIDPETNKPMGIFKNALALVFMKGVKNA